MRTLNLSGFKPLDSLSISVSQGAVTAGPYSVGSWGGGGGGGTIAIVAAQTTEKIAPESARFSVDLSAATFDTAGPGAGEVYDARKHDLIYFWDFGDPGTWAAPVNIIAAWKNRNVGLGPDVAHLYRNHGTYTASVLVIEPSSGKTATAETSVVINDPDLFYVGLDTICINPIGDGDFSGAPAGAAHENADSLKKIYQEGGGYNAIPDAVMAKYQDGNPKRWLFKRGGEYTLRINMESEERGPVTFGAYGPGSTKPVLNADTPVPSSNDFPLSPTANFCLQAAGVVQTIRMFGLRFQSTYDPLTMATETAPAIAAGNFLFSTAQLDIVIDDCQFDGFGGSVFYMAGNLGTTTYNRFHINDSIISRFGGQYPLMVIGGAHTAGHFAMTGTRVAQEPGGVASDNGSGSSRSLIRTGVWKTYVAGCDLFITDDSQPVLSPIKTPAMMGYTLNMHSNAMEGGAYGVSVAGNWSQTPMLSSSVHNMIIDGNIHLGAYRTIASVEALATGLTIRNNLFVQPSGTCRINGCRGFVLLERHPSANPEVDAAPIMIYNNTIWFDRTAAENHLYGGTAPTPEIQQHNTDPGKTDGVFPNVSEHNNIMHQPNFVTTDPETPVIGFAPLSETVLWAPRNTGFRSPTTFVLDTAYATPVNALKDSKPQTGSAALGAAITGSVSYMDILGTTRTAPADKGAWEVA